MVSADSSTRFFAICRKNGIFLQEGQVEKLVTYVALLQEWNTRVNLISRAGQSDVWFAHILHSATPLFVFSIRSELVVLDLGTGGGLPGIPISILRPDLRVVLLDSIRKKMAAVNNIVERLALSNVETLTARAEDMPALGYGRRFDLVLARGVARLVDLAKWSAPLLKRTQSAAPTSTSTNELPVPSLVAYKGGDLSFEISVMRHRVPQAILQTKDIVFPGSEELPLEGKKLLVVTNL